jgi:predicted dehydrogenase
MSSRGELRAGIVGYGVMGRAHCYGYRVAPMLRRLPVTPVVTVMSGRNEAAVSATASACGVDDHVTDWRTLIHRDDVDVVDICTPPGAHAEIAIAAAGRPGGLLREAAGHFVCRRPRAAHWSPRWLLTKPSHSP